MQLLDQYYEITQTKPSDYNQRQLESIKTVVSMSEERYIASLAHELLHSLAFGYDGSRSLIIKSNNLLKRLAAAGIDRYQCELAGRIVAGDIAPPPGTPRAVAARDLYEKAYQQGHAAAAAALSYLHEVPHKGIDTDAKKAAFYKQEADRLGYKPGSVD